MPNRQGPGFIEEMMRSTQGGMPPQGGLAPTQQQSGIPNKGNPIPSQSPVVVPGGQNGGVEIGPMGPERMVPGAMVIVELNGMFYLVPSINEQRQPMDDAAAVAHLQQTGLFYASSADPRLLVDYAEQAMSGGGQSSGKKQAGGAMPPM